MRKRAEGCEDVRHEATRSEDSDPLWAGDWKGWLAVFCIGGLALRLQRRMDKKSPPNTISCHPAPTRDTFVGPLMLFALYL